MSYSCMDTYIHALFNLQVPLKLPLRLTWRAGPDTPFEMSGYVQSVMVQGTVYVEGVDAKDCIVMAYDTGSGKWTQLPPYTEHGALQ